MDSLDSKDSSRDFNANRIISFYFYLYLMFYVCVQRFNVIFLRKKKFETKPGLRGATHEILVQYSTRFILRVLVAGWYHNYGENAN